VAITPDGSKIVSGSDDNTIRVWRESWESWLEGGCNQLRLHPVFVEAFIEDEEDEEDREVAGEAVKTCEKLAWTDTQKAEFRVSQGLAIAKLTGNLNQAKEKFKEAQQLDPDFYASLKYDPEEKARQLVKKDD
jgi:hypothetical protein